MPNANANLYRHFADAFAGNEQQPLLVTDADESFGFGDLDAQSARMAGFLADLGVSVGDRVSVQVEKSPQALCLYLACLRAGFVFHPLNPGYTRSELAYFIDDARPAAIVCDPAKCADLEDIATQADCVRQVLTLDAAGRGSLINGAADVAADLGVADRTPEDLAALLYSSGTTGTPKGIKLTHGNLYSNARTLVDFWQFTDDDRLLHALPIFHVHGLFVAIGCVLLSGASMRWLPRFDVDKVIDYLPECTVMMGVPTYYTRLLAARRFDAEVCRNMRLFISGSAPLLTDTFEAFEQRTGHRILERYGMTETNMNTSNPVAGKRKPGTVGPPLPGVDARVVGEEGEPLPPGEIGRLQVRGPNVFAGYWNLPEKTREDFTDDGFFETGDQASIDEDGYVSIVGRAKDLVITGGLNVYPKEVEQFIDTIPGVVESAVIGVPHPDFGEGVVAVVVAETASDLDEREIIRQARGALANYKLPKRIFFVDELPRNTMSKVQKNVLRDRYASIFASSPR